MRLNALTTLPARPGVVKDDGLYATEGRFTDADKVRFYRGSAQRFGGWSAALSDTFSGICRGLFAWGSIFGKKRLAVGTHTHLYGYVGGGLYDVTPTTATLRLYDPFTTTNASTTVVVTHFGHGLQTGDTASFASATAVGGITVDGAYTVTVTSPSTFEITHSAPATSTATGGGAPDVTYSRWQAGNENGLGGGGYGVGGYGTGGYSTGVNNGFFQPRTWSLASWGQELLACPQYGALYKWNADEATPAAVVSDAPPVNLYAYVTAERHVVLLGTTQIAVQGREFDPLLIRWSSREDLSDWEPSATNTARDFKVSKGSRLIAGASASGENLVWTDKALYAMRYTNYPYWYTVKERGSECGLIGPNAFVTKDGAAFWVSPGGEFYIYDGGVPRPIPNVPVRDFVFENITPAQEHKVYAFLNPQFNEVGWLYPASPSLEVNRYVIYNYAEDAWSVGTFDRTAWLGQDVFEYPLASSPTGTLFFQEFGKSADGAAVQAHLETGPIDLGDGADTLLCDRYVPDFKIEGAIKTTIRAYDFDLTNPITVSGPHRTKPDTTHHDTRFAGRAVRFLWESGGTQDAWRLGRVRVSLRKAGRR